MSAEELVLKDNPLKMIVKETNFKNYPIFIILHNDVEVAKLCLDHSQANMLMLWLQEHLK